MKKIITRSYGGQGSGNWGHEGRPGEVGGSSPGGGSLPSDRSDSGKYRGIKKVKSPVSLKTTDAARALTSLLKEWIDVEADTDKGGERIVIGQKDALKAQRILRKKNLM